MTAESIARGLGLRRVGQTWRGSCPIHGGSSFTLSEKDGKPLFTCWGGCGRGAVLDELKARGLWPESNLTATQKRDFAAQRRRDEADLQDARLFGDVAHILAEQVLDELSANDQDRMIYTKLIAALKTDTGMLLEFRNWRAREPKLTAGLVFSGRKHQERMKRLILGALEGVDYAAA